MKNLFLIFNLFIVLVICPFLSNADTKENINYNTFIALDDTVKNNTKEIESYKGNVTIYPLPADIEFNVDHSIPTDSKITYQLISLESGTITTLEDRNSIDHNLASFDVNFYTPGHYIFVILENDKKIYSKKILINHFGI